MNRGVNRGRSREQTTEERREESRERWERERREGREREADGLPSWPAALAGLPRPPSQVPIMQSPRRCQPTRPGR